MTDRNRAGDEFDAFLEQADGGTWVCLGIVALSMVLLFLRLMF